MNAERESSDDTGHGPREIRKQRAGRLPWDIFNHLLRVVLLFDIIPRCSTSSSAHTSRPNVYDSHAWAAWPRNGRRNSQKQTQGTRQGRHSDMARLRCHNLDVRAQFYFKKEYWPAFVEPSPSKYTLASSKWLSRYTGTGTISINSRSGSLQM